jgi:hypothetical protein
MESTYYTIGLRREELCLGKRRKREEKKVTAKRLLQYLRDEQCGGTVKH